MEERRGAQGLQPGSLAWLQTGLLLGVSSAFVFFLGLGATSGQMSEVGINARFADSLWALPGSMFPVFPLIVGVSLGMCRQGRGVVRAAATIVLLTTLLMATVDLLAPPASLPSLLVPTWQQGSVVASSGDALAFEGRALPSLFHLLVGTDPGIGEVLDRYPPGHPRLMLTNGLHAFLLMVLPVGVVGLMLGVGTWIRGRVAFRHRKDELLARIVLAWIIAPMSLWLVAEFSGDAQTAVLFRGGAPPTILIPAVPFLIIGALGWWAALKAERDLDFGWDSFGEES